MIKLQMPESKALPDGLSEEMRQGLVVLELRSRLLRIWTALLYCSTTAATITATTEKKRGKLIQNLVPILRLKPGIVSR